MNKCSAAAINSSFLGGVVNDIESRLVGLEGLTPRDQKPATSFCERRRPF